MDLGCCICKKEFIKIRKIYIRADFTGFLDNSIHGKFIFISDVGSVAEWLARRTRDLEVAGSISDQAML